MRRLAIAAALLAGGCGKTDPANRLMETGWFVDTGDFSAEGCKAKLGGVEPSHESTGWYHRDAPSLWVTHADPTAYTIELVDEHGQPAPVTPVWDATELNLTFRLDAPLQPDTGYVVSVTDCAANHRSSFRTSSLGMPMQIDPRDLVGRTWHLDMLGANWIQPGGAEALIQLYFSAPALLGVRYADDERIDLLGAPGLVDPFGALYQDVGATWDFPTGDFAPPFFESQANVVVFQFQGVEIPIHDARLAATVSPDGRSLGGGELSGLGDTRGLGSFLPAGGSEGAICDLAESLGIDCQACPDGEPYCMFLEARQIDGALVEGLTLVPRAG